MGDELKFPKPTRQAKKRSERLNHSHKQHSRNKIYRLISKPTYLAGLAAGQGNKRPICERCEERPASQIHHRKGRSGADLLDCDYFTALCGTCHDWVHANPREAMASGWLISRNAREADPEQE